MRKLTLTEENARDPEVLALLPDVECLSVEGDPGGINFAALRQMRECVLADPPSLGSVAEAPLLEDLSVFGGRVRNLHGLEGASRLRGLYLNEMRRLESLAGVESLRLETLEILYLARLRYIGPATSIRTLREIRIEACRSVTDVARVGEIGSLSILWTPAGPLITSLHFLSNLSGLRELHVGNTEKAPDPVSLAPLRHLLELRVLRMFDMRKATGIETIGDLPRLEHLMMNRGPELHSLSFLRRLQNLREFGLWRTNIRDGDLSPLLELPAMERVLDINPPRAHYSHTVEQLNEALTARTARRAQ